MNPLFRSARRTLSWGLLATLSVVLLVLARGVDPEVRLAFQPPVESAEDAAESEDAAEPQPPEHFAKADSDTRLDATTASISPANGSGRSKINAQPSLPSNVAVQPEGPQVSPGKMPQLPPLPSTSDEATDSTEQANAAAVIELPPPPDFTEAPAAEPVKEETNTGTARISPAANAASTLPPPDAARAVPDPKFVAQLAALQEQLDRIAAAQEQHRTTQQTWLESHYQQYQEQLEKKLSGIEAGLKDLQEKSELLSTLTKDQTERTDRVAPQASITRGNRTVTSMSNGKLGAPGMMRDVLESLVDKSNVNLTLSINVAGDVEMSLQDPQSRGGLTPGSNGYIVGKDGRKTHVNSPRQVPPPEEDYLPPIVQNPDATDPN